ncbi:amidase [Azospirillum griseum]|uniref:Amidase n=1 Tax=Azospirillum griseum TaxID=2496639 RepID=A0A431VEX5_9PROT|nr:amidase [Azospirillum griseum]RTR18611.1 amidase [Azospirillum griseum]
MNRDAHHPTPSTPAPADPWRWDAATLAGRLARRELSAREAVQSCLDRLDAVNPRINAVVDAPHAAALAAADRADALAASGAALPPLHGVPVTTKINVDQVGVATTNGVRAFTGLIADSDSPSIANLRRAGAVFLGRTNAPPFSLRWFTDNDPHGLTLNPWDPALNVGGSSGGAAAAVATGIGPIAHGNDLAGSVRLPASACGVYGLRPTTGRIPAFNPTGTAERSLCLQLGATQGVLARSVRDIRLGLMAMSARDPRDPWWVPAPLDQEGDRETQRVALYTGAADCDVDPAVSAALRRAGDWLSDAGYTVEEAAPPRFVEAADLWMTLLGNEIRTPAMQAALALTDEGLRRSQELTIHWAPVMSAEERLAGLATRTTLQRAWTLFFERYPLLLLPTSWRLPFPVGYDTVGPDEARAVLRAHSPCSATAMLGVPAISVPVVRAPLPIGVQIVGARFRDGLCLAAAAALEARLGPVDPIDPVDAAKKLV